MASGSWPHLTFAPSAVTKPGTDAAFRRDNTLLFSDAAQCRASSACLLVFRKCHYWFVPTEWLIGSYGKCWPPAAGPERLPASYPFLDTRHACRGTQRCLSLRQVPAPGVANLCHPETAKRWKSLKFRWLRKSLNSGEMLLCLLGLTFPWPGREYCLWEGESVFHSLARFPTCTAALLSVLFLDPSKAEQHLCCDFQEVWVWVCTEDPRGVRCLDFAHWMSIHCCRARLAFSVIFIFFSRWAVLPLSGLHQTHLPGKPDFRGVTVPIHINNRAGCHHGSYSVVQFLYCPELVQNPKLLFSSSLYSFQNYWYILFQWTRWNCFRCFFLHVSTSKRLIIWGSERTIRMIRV